MTPIQIILVALVIVLLYLIYTYRIKGSSNKLTNILPANSPYNVPESSLSTISGNNDLYNYTISLWIYVESWSTTASPKPVLVIPKSSSSESTDIMHISLGVVDNTLLVTLFQSPTPSVSGFSTMSPAPVESMSTMSLTKKKGVNEGMQNLNVGSLIEGVYQKVSGRSGLVKKTEGMSVKEGIDNLVSVVPSIPLQSWTNIAVNVNGKALDIYINGKLVQSSILPYVPKPVKPKMILTPEPGFSGWTSNLQFYPYNLSPKQINNIYTNGYTGSPESLLSLLGKYSMKIVFVDNTQTPQ